MKKIVTTLTCDACGKTIPCDQYGSAPDPWLRISTSGHWMNAFGDASDTEFHACSPTCGAVILGKAEKAMQRLIERFPTAVKESA